MTCFPHNTQSLTHCPKYFSPNTFFLTVLKSSNFKILGFINFKKEGTKKDRKKERKGEGERERGRERRKGNQVVGESFPCDAHFLPQLALLHKYP